MSDYSDQIGLSTSAFDLLMHHMEKLQHFCTDPDDKKVIGGCLYSLAHIFDALIRLNESQED